MTGSVPGHLDKCIHSYGWYQVSWWGGKVHIVLWTVIQGSHRESVYEDCITTRRDGQDTKILLYGHEKGRIAPPVSVIGKTKISPILLAYRDKQ